MTRHATGGYVSVGQPVVLGEHGCSLRMPPRARLPITGSFHVEVPADTLAALSTLPEALDAETDEDE